MEQSLAINEELGRKEGMASSYGNMGNVYRIRGDLDKARELWKQSASIFRKLGNSKQAEQIEEWIRSLE